MNETPRSDVTINGGGSVAAGTYETVTINGGGTITGDIICTALKINGAGTCRGSVQAGTVFVNGTATVDGSVQANEMTVNGDATVRAGIGVGRLVARGNLVADVGIAAHSVELTGVIRCSGDLKADTLRAEGALSASHVAVESFDLAAYGASKITSIEAQRVVVRAPGSLADVLMFFTDKELTAETIRASEVWLEHTVANVVSAGNATVGRDSRIGLVQYSGSYTLADNGLVSEARRVEADS